MASSVSSEMRTYLRVLHCCAISLLFLCSPVRAEYMHNMTSVAGSDRETSEVLDSDDVVVADVEFEPMPSDMNLFGSVMDREATATVVKSYKWVVHEGTSLTIHLGWFFR